MKIRKAGLKDLKELIPLYDHLRGGLAWVKKPPMKTSPAHEKALKQMLGDKSIHLLVGEEGGKIVGTCTLYILPRVYWSGRPWAVLDSIVIGEDVQGRARHAPHPPRRGRGQEGGLLPGQPHQQHPAHPRPPFL